MKKYFLYPIGILCLFLTESCMVSKNDAIRVAMEQNKSKLNKEMQHDAKFAVCAADAGKFEEKVSEYAESNAASEKVKMLAQTMVRDHSKANAELEALAAKKSMTLPSNLSEKSQKKYEKITKKSGRNLDKKYLHCMKKAHKKAICLFKKESKKGKDAEMKSWASSQIATLKQHKDLIKQTCKDVK